MNNHNHTTDHLSDEEIRAEIEDQLMDRCLEEVLGGVTPELADRKQRPVVLAPASTEETPTAPETTSPRVINWVASLVALGVCLCVGVILQSGVFVPEDEALEGEVAMSEEAKTQMNALSPTLQSATLEGDSTPHPTFIPQDKLVAGADTYLLQVPESGENKAVREQLLAEQQKNTQLQIDYEQMKKAAPGNERLLSEVETLERSASPQQANPGHPYAGPNSGSPNAPITFQQKNGDMKSNADFGLSELPRLNKMPYHSRLFKDNQGLQEGFTTELYSVVPNNDVPLGWRKSTMQWDENGKWFYSGIADGLEGIGPGNSGDNYAPVIENEFQVVTDSPLSTFSVDVDTASYSNTRRMLTQYNMLPPPDAVRIEEMINYFNYDYPAPVGDDPFSVTVEASVCPWQPSHQLVRIGLKGKEIPLEEKPASNLVFLLDVSGSMNKPNKIELLKSCLKMMVDYLGENDSIAIVTYASGTRVVLPSTSGDQKSIIMNALDNLRAGGSTNGAAGIQLAYEQATKNFIPGGINRVILATDGDFNVGITSQGDLHRMIEEKAKSNVFLTTLGFGFGNLQDNTIELLADKGNGNYSYIDTLQEGRKVLIDEMCSTLHTIAKDVKIQIEFNPLEVAGYRLIGYENRILAARDFNDDTKDAGEIGAGHTVTAFYELIPASEAVDKEVDDLEFQKPLKATKAAKNGDLMVVKLRYKKPDEDHSALLKMNVANKTEQLARQSRDFRFAASVASFGMILRGSKYVGHANYDSVLEIAESSLGDNPESYRSEFVELVKLAKKLDQRK